MDYIGFVIYLDVLINIIDSVTFEIYLDIIYSVFSADNQPTTAVLHTVHDCCVFAVDRILYCRICGRLKCTLLTI